MSEKNIVASTNGTGSGGDDVGGDDFFDAVSNNSQDEEADVDEEQRFNQKPILSQTTYASVSTTNKRTVLTYSDRNGLLLTNTSTATSVAAAGGNTVVAAVSSPIAHLDPYDDFVLSNKLNAITLSNSLELHHYVFHNDLNSIATYIQRYEQRSPEQISDYLSIRDLHGNTPLHLAAMQGHLEAARMLVKHGAVVKARNKQLWTPLNEAISYGDRSLIRALLVKFESELDKIVADSKPNIISALQDMLDFYVEIKWDFESWIPLVSRFLPSDVCKLYKCGRKLRLDCTLGDLAAKSASGSSGGRSGTASGDSNSSSTSSSSASPFNWQRGDLTFLFDVDKIGDKKSASIVFMDNKKRTFCYVDKRDDDAASSLADTIGDLIDDAELDKEVDLLLSREMVHIKLDTKQANFLPTQTGWFSKRDKVEEINGYQCQFYDVSNLYIVSKMRNEHLSEEEVRKREEKQKKIKEKMNNNHRNHQGGMKKSKSKQLSQQPSSNSISKNNNNSDDVDSVDQDLSKVNLEEDGGGEEDYDEFDDEFNVEHRPSLPPPVKPHVTWSEYITAEEGRWPNLGRKSRVRESRKEFKAQLAMSQDFPLTINDLNNLLEALAPLAKFRKLKEFINLRLPPGFPVKIEIPIVHTVTAKVSFQNFKKNYKSDPILFKIPPNYTEENIQEALMREQKKERESKEKTPPTTSTTITTTPNETLTQQF